MFTLTEAPRHEALIDLSAIRENARILVSRAGGRPVVAVVSADGFGHGMIEASRAAVDGGVSWLSVSHPSDADLLRNAGISADIPVYAGPGVPSLSGSFEGENLVQVGPELYGLVSDPDLRPAMRVSAAVVGTKTIAPGEGVSYGYTYRAPRRTNLALIGIGYADGLDRSASNVASIRLGGSDRLVAGRVAMNALVLELGDDSVMVGDEAVVFGDPNKGEPHASEWAASIGRSAAEASAAFGAHLPRGYR